MTDTREDQRISDLLLILSPPAGNRPWFGGASPIGSLRGVSVDEALWKPYSTGHSIWEQALHIAYWIYAVRRILDGSPKGSFPRSPSNWPALPDSLDRLSFRNDCRLVRNEYDRFVDVVRNLSPLTLDEPAPGSQKYRYIDLILGVVQHNTHHTAQIQLLKRLQRSDGS